jgi:hypothetical protein
MVDICASTDSAFHGYLLALLLFLQSRYGESQHVYEPGQILKRDHDIKLSASTVGRILKRKGLYEGKGIAQAPKGRQEAQVAPESLLVDEARLPPARAGDRRWLRSWKGDSP